MVSGQAGRARARVVTRYRAAHPMAPPGREQRRLQRLQRAVEQLHQRQLAVVRAAVAVAEVVQQQRQRQRQRAGRAEAQHVGGK